MKKVYFFVSVLMYCSNTFSQTVLPYMHYVDDASCPDCVFFRAPYRTAGQSELRDAINRADSFGKK